jgi:LmbE family N-acetylglucosaminyl deacetylase
MNNNTNDRNGPIQPERVLVITAHPDDPEFGSAGTVAGWAHNATRVTYVIVTNGSKGTDDPSITSQQLVEMRQEEQRAAAAILGVSEVVFLGYPDGEIYNTPELRRDLVRQIRLHRPELLITHDPTARIMRNEWINHPDHRAVGDTALDAVFPLARDRYNFPEHVEEGLQPHKVLDVFLIGTNEPNTWIDITETLELKIEALQQHRSQIKDPQELAQRMRQRAEDYAQDQPYKYAEPFRHIRLRR